MRLIEEGKKPLRTSVNGAFSILCCPGYGTNLYWRSKNKKIRPRRDSNPQPQPPESWIITIRLRGLDLISSAVVKLSSKDL